ncbi:MAG TPA: UDP-N-acetylmuramoyl-L-alanine--D-glutamate ligase [Vicinamibacterales bacterium]|nr:UDP-N-acetylmuramoyl-L-alanine--D-glutamate ligase [Vicinamibacterales bacterium]
MTERGDFSVRGKRVTVVGAARSGVAAAELLVRRGAEVLLSDVRGEIEDSERLRKAGVALELGGHTKDTFVNADLIVLSPGVPARQPAIDAARQAGVPVVAELELASRWLRGRIVAITGTKGKSTTTTLTGKMLEAGGHKVLVGGNIGHALSAQVEASTKDTIHVVETSSFQLEGIVTFHPWVAVLLNFSPDHLDRHATVEEYAGAKARIFENQTDGDWAVLNADDPPSLRLAERARARRLLFSLRRDLAEGVLVAGDAIVRRTPEGDEPLVPLSAVKLIGRHLVADVLAACAVAAVAGVEAAAMTKAVEGFAGLEHALEPVAEVGGVRFVNDSKATNVEAALRAIEAFEPGLVVIMGGRFKGGDLGQLAAPLVERAATVVAIGEARLLIHDAFAGRVPVVDADDMHGAVRRAFAAAAPGGSVVLAPACASFDMFRDYAERGRVFKQEVRRLESEWKTTREQ